MDIFLNINFLQVSDVFKHNDKILLNSIATHPADYMPYYITPALLLGHLLLIRIKDVFFLMLINNSTPTS